MEGVDIPTQHHVQSGQLVTSTVDILYCLYPYRALWIVPKSSIFEHFLEINRSYTLQRGDAGPSTERYIRRSNPYTAVFGSHLYLAVIPPTRMKTILRVGVGKQCK